MSEKNGKRSNIISSLKRKNIKLIKSMREELKNMVISEIHTDAALRFEKNILQCSNLSLYKENGQFQSIDYIASHTCEHKACFICNFLRQKKIRRKYMRWFNDNEFLIFIKSGEILKPYTSFQFEKLEAEKGKQEIVKKQGFDIMHLTLTVPHSEIGFRGEKYYQKTLRAIFNRMRKTDFWQDWIYGGEMGIEITRKGNGLHIHIHSLIFVRKAIKNRNTVHWLILKNWNALTIDKAVNRTFFDPETIEAIKKGNKDISDSDILTLDPQGSTIINLKNIHSKDKLTGKITYNISDKMGAIMEAISYHFEPTAFDKEAGEFNLPLLIDLLPVLYNMRIYDRFGVLYRETPLSMNDNSFLEDLQDIKELGEAEINQVENNNYFVTNPAYVFHKVNEKKEVKKIVLSNEAKKRRIDLNSSTTGGALEELGEMVKLMKTKGINYN